MGWHEAIRNMDNGIIEITRYYLPDNKKGAVVRRKSSSGSSNSEKILKDSIRTMSRLLNNNFSVNKDCMLLLTYNEIVLQKIVGRGKIPENNEQLLYDFIRRDVENYIRRCRCTCRKKGIPFRYIFVISDLDGDSFNSTRIHIHMVINAEARDVCLTLWHNGNGFGRTLYSRHHGDMTDLARYLLCQVRHQDAKNRYHVSRGLNKPVPVDRPVDSAKATPVKLAGYAPIASYESTPGRPQTAKYYKVIKQ